jgi:hypothetical protein
MKYKVSFTVTDSYPETEIEAKDRDEAVRLYQDLWKQGKLAHEGVHKDVKWKITSVWKGNGR